MAQLNASTVYGDLTVTGTANVINTIKGEPIDTMLKIEDKLYNGVDLTVKFANEISNFSSAWTWIKSRITNNNYEGIHVCDYIPFTANDTLTSWTMNAQVAGINTYTNSNYNPTVYNHIDFICKECWPKLSWTVDGTTYYTKWNLTNNNNGNSTTQSPWKASNLYNVLNNRIYNYLPAELRNVIIEKGFLVSYRYSASGLLTEDNTWDWGTIGKLWCPTEVEVYGCKVWNNSGFSVGTSIQYPIFANRSKIRVVNGSRCNWWLLTPRGGSSTSACIVNNTGDADYTSASYPSLYAPVCFRIS